MRRKKGLPLISAPPSVKWLARAAAWAVAGLLALLIAANSNLFWEKGVESLLGGAQFDVAGISTDIATMVAARKFVFAGKLPAAPLLRITGQDLFIGYDPLLRRDLVIDARSIEVESVLELPPETGPGAQRIPLLGAFRNVRMHCPDLSFRVTWKDWTASCEGSRLVCTWPSPGTCSTRWEADSIRVEKAGKRVAGFRGVSVADSFERTDGIGLPAIFAGVIEAGFGRMDVDLDILSGLGNRKKVAATGEFSGTGRVVLEGGGLKEMDIELFSGGGGTVALARDFIDGYLERNPSQVKKESMKIVLENLQDYAFNTGVIHIGLAGDVVEVGIDLEGETGSRKIDLGFHDFIEDGRLAENPLFSIGR